MDNINDNENMQNRKVRINTVTIKLKDVMHNGEMAFSVSMDVEPKIESEEDVTNAVRMGVDIIEYLKKREAEGASGEEKGDSGLVL